MILVRRDWLVIVFVTNCVDSHTQQCTHAHTPGHGHTRDTFRSRSHALLSDRHTTLLHIHCPRGPLSPFFSLEFPRQRYRVTHTSTRACHTVLPRVFTTSTLVRVTRSLSRPMHKSLAPPSFPPPLSDAPRPHTPTTPSLSVILHRYPPSATFPSHAAPTDCSSFFFFSSDALTLGVIRLSSSSSSLFHHRLSFLCS